MQISGKPIYRYLVFSIFLFTCLSALGESGKSLEDGVYYDPSNRVCNYNISFTEKVLKVLLEQNCRTPGKVRVFNYSAKENIYIRNDNTGSFRGVIRIFNAQTFVLETQRWSSSRRAWYVAEKWVYKKDNPS